MTYYELVPKSEDAAIDRFNIHSAEVAHCTHTTEPVASYSHSGGPTVFRQNRSTAMTLSRPLRPTPLFGFSPVSPSLPKANGHCHGKQKRSQMGSKRAKQLGLTRFMPAYLIRLARAHKLPSFEAPVRGMTINQLGPSHTKENVATLKNARFGGTMTS